MSIHTLFKNIFLITTFIFIFAFLALSFKGNIVNAESVSNSVTVSAQVYACELIVQFSKGKDVENLNLQTSYLLSIKDKDSNKIYSLVGESDQNGYSFQDLCSNQIYIMNSRADIYIEAFNGLRKKINNKEIFVYARSTLNIVVDKEDFKILPDTIKSSVISTSPGIPLNLPNMDAYLNFFENYSGFISKLILLASIGVGVSYGSIYISKIFKSLLKEYIYAVKYIYRYITLGNIKNVYS
jgi:hypothetical protein